MHTYKSQPVTYIQKKLDGHNMRLVHTEDGHYRVLSRRDSDYTRYMLQWSWFRLLMKRIPRDTTVLGELYVPSAESTEVMPHLRSGLPVAFSAFGLVSWEGRVWQGDHSDFHKLCNAHGIPYEPAELISRKFNRPVQTPAVPLTRNEVDRLLADAVEGRYEGYVVKLDMHSPNKWYKIKQNHTVDVVVIGCMESTTGKFKGGLGSYEVALFNGRGTLESCGSVGSGFDTDDRMASDSRSKVGAVMEVRYDALTSFGQLRAPRFVRWRDDKSAEECTQDQLVA